MDPTTLLLEMPVQGGARVRRARARRVLRPGWPSFQVVRKLDGT